MVAWTIDYDERVLSLEALSPEEFETLFQEEFSELLLQEGLLPAGRPTAFYLVTTSFPTSNIARIAGSASTAEMLILAEEACKKIFLMDRPI